MPSAWTTKTVSSSRNGRDPQASRRVRPSRPSLCTRVSVGALRVPATAPSIPAASISATNTAMAR